MAQREAAELDYFWAALMFYTRIPVPENALHSQQVLNKSRKYFTLVGVIVGLVAACTYVLASLVFGTALSVALSMLTSVLITGAFHEDGFADSCDGLGGGWSIEQVLTIMKDSRIGTYGTVGLLFMLTLKFLALLEIANQNSNWVFAFVCIAGHAFSRQVASGMVERYDYVQDIDASKIKPIADAHLTSQETTLSWCFAAIPLALLFFVSFGGAVIAISASALVGDVFMRYCYRRIGGYTGDVLGATQQLCELSLYLSLAAALSA